MNSPLDEEIGDLRPAADCGVVERGGEARPHLLVDVLAQVQPHRNLLQLARHRSLVQ